MRFEYLWLLSAVLLFLWCERRCPLRLELLYFPKIGRLPRQTADRRWQIALRWAIWSGLVLAAASPVVSRTFLKRHDPQSATLFVINDVMGGKRTTQIADVLDRVKGSYVGVVMVCDEPKVLAPLTSQVSLLAELLRQKGRQNCASAWPLSDAVALGLNLLRKASDAQKRLVIVSWQPTGTSALRLEATLKMLKRSGAAVALLYRPRHDARIDRLADWIRRYGEKVYRFDSAEGLNKALKEVLSPAREAVRPQTVRADDYLYLYPLFVAAMSLLGYMYLMNRTEAKE